jgi:hypothetical protein
MTTKMITTKKCDSILEPILRRERERDAWLPEMVGSTSIARHMKVIPPQAHLAQGGETAEKQKLNAAAPAKAALPNMADLLFVPFSGVSFFHTKTNALIERVAQHMTDECGDDAEGALGMLLTSKRAARDGRENFSKSNGMFFLISGNEVLTTAMLCSSNQLSFIWTPPKHRRKGYSAELLSKVGDLWAATTTTIPLWVCADKKVVGVPRKAGWVCDGIANKDGTMDYYPPSLADRYLSRRTECNAARKDFADEAMVFLHLNKDPHEGQDAEWENFTRRFPQTDVRKRLSGVRVIAPPPQQGKVALDDAATWLKEKCGAKYLAKDKEAMVSLMKAFIAAQGGGAGVFNDLD